MQILGLQGKCLIGLFSFVSLLLSCMICLYILAVKPLSVALFANVFSHSVGGLLVLLITCYTKACKFGYHLFIFVFISIALED